MKGRIRVGKIQFQKFNIIIFNELKIFLKKFTK